MAKTLVIKGANYSANKVATIEFDRIHTTDISIDDSVVEFASIGTTHQIAYTITPSNSEDSILWESSNTNVCTVDTDGIVTAVGCGSATITATSNGHSDTVSVSCIVDLAGFVRAPKTYFSGENSNDHSSMMDTYIGISNTGYDTYMVMIAVDNTRSRLNANYNFAILNSTTNVYELIETYTSGAAGRIFNNIGYVVPILLPNNCSRVTCVAPNDKYAPCLTFVKSETRSGEDNTSKKYFTAYKEAKKSPSSYDWVFTLSTDYNVPSGYDAFVVIWKANTDDGATSFANMTAEQLAEFRVVCS